MFQSLVYLLYRYLTTPLCVLPPRPRPFNRLQSTSCTIDVYHFDVFTLTCNKEIGTLLETNVFPNHYLERGRDTRETSRLLMLIDFT